MQRDNNCGGGSDRYYESIIYDRTFLYVLYRNNNFQNDHHILYTIMFPHNYDSRITFPHNYVSTISIICPNYDHKLKC